MLSITLRGRSDEIKLQSGILRFYTPSGIVNSQLQFQDGKLIEERRYFLDGQVEKITNFQHNVAITYRQNGTMMCKTLPEDEICYDFNGEKL